MTYEQQIINDTKAFVEKRLKEVKEVLKELGPELTQEKIGYLLYKNDLEDILSMLTCIKKDEE